MELRTDGLRLRLSPVQAFDDDGWGKVQLDFDVPAVHGSYVAWAWRPDWERFHRELADLSETLETGREAHLDTVEREYQVDLAMRNLGHIDGAYAFRPGVANETKVAVEGRFKLDQSFLPGLCRDLSDLLSGLTHAGSV